METVGFYQMAASAGIAACLAETMTLPIDTAKVRMQVASRAAGAKPIGFVPVLAKMVREEGITAWWKGLPAGLHSRQRMFSLMPDLGIKIVAGMASGAIGMTVANPTDVVKVRLQSAVTAAREGSEAAQLAASRNPKHTVYRGAMHAYATIIKEEGVLGLWRGLGPNIVRNMIVCAAEMVAYDEFKRMGMRWLPDGLACHCLAGFGAGFMATIIGSPVDVVKTRYMNARPGQYSGVTNCFFKLTREAGPLGFYKGFTPNVLRMGVFNMLVFVLYEQILRQIRQLSVQEKQKQPSNL